MPFFRKKSRIDDHGTSRPISQFLLDDMALLAEIASWAETGRPIVLSASSAMESDYAVLLHGIGQVIKSLRDPDRKISQTVRSEVMEVLRCEGLDTHGFEPMAMAQGLRGILQRAMAQISFAQRINRSPSPEESSDLHQQIAVLQAKNATLQEVIDHLSRAPSSGTIHDAIV